MVESTLKQEAPIYEECWSFASRVRMDFSDLAISHTKRRLEDFG
jgi:hypothetical protein